MPRLVRRQPLWERLKARLDPYDFLLWLAEELDAGFLEQLEKEWAIPAGVVLNLIFVIARSNGKGKSRSYDDVFGDDSSGGGLLSWLVRLKAHRNLGMDHFLISLGFLHRLDSIDHGGFECNLYVLAKAALPLVRELGGQRSEYSFCAQSAR